MKRSMLSPFLSAYSDSLLGFIQFIRQRFPLVSENGSLTTLEDFDDEMPEGPAVR